MEHYHFSYDVYDLDSNFETYDEARRFLLCVIKNTSPTDVHSYNASSLIISYDQVQPNLFDYLHNNIGPYFYFTLSLIAFTEGPKYVPMVYKFPNKSLDIALQGDLKNLTCDFDDEKTITPYVAR